MPGKQAIFLLVLAGYCLLNAILRVLYASSLGLDEAELIVLSQGFEWGRGSQPPLYAWLQIPVFALFGKTVFAIVAVKEALIFGTLLFLCLSARMVFNDENKAVLATLAAFTLPQLAWESQRALSHTVIATALGAMTLWALLRLACDGRAKDHALLGLFIGLGVLSKYNYVLFVAALLIAAGFVADFRRRLASRSMVLTVAIAAAIVLPHIIWLLDNLPETLSRVQKLRIVEADTVVDRVVDGVVSVFEGVQAYVIVPIGVFLGVAFLVPAGGGETARKDGWPAAGRLLLLLPVVALALTCAAAVAAGATRVMDRWLHPVFFVLPLVLMVLLDGRFTERRRNMLAVISAGIAVTCTVAMTVVHVFPDRFGRTFWATAPFGRIAERVAEAGFSGGYVLASSSFISGNLGHRFPGSTVADPPHGLWPVRGAGGDLLLIWPGETADPPEKLLELRRELCGEAADIPLTVERVSELFEHSREFRYDVAFAVQPLCGRP